MWPAPHRDQECIAFDASPCRGQGDAAARFLDVIDRRPQNDLDAFPRKLLQQNRAGLRVGDREEPVSSLNQDDLRPEPDEGLREFGASGPRTEHQQAARQGFQ